MELLKNYVNNIQHKTREEIHGERHTHTHGGERERERERENENGAGPVMNITM